MSISSPVPVQRPSDPPLLELVRELEGVRAEMLRAEQDWLRRCPEIDPSYAASARNLLHYLALRGRDLRGLQGRLMELGLSSLGRCEAHALATVDAVLCVLRHLTGSADAGAAERTGNEFDGGNHRLEQHTEALLGPAQALRRVRVMVTMPDEAALDLALVRGWLERGMDLARINCAHGNETQWRRMIANIRRAESTLGRRCRILMDLAGPKLRTGPVEPGPAVLRVRPRRDVLGRVTSPARLWLTPARERSAAPAPCDGVLPVAGAWLGQIEDGQRIRLVDARGARRELTVLRRMEQGAWSEVSSTCYFVPGTELSRRAGKRWKRLGRVGELPRLAGEIALLPGDELLLTRSLEPGRSAERDRQGRLLTPAQVGCTLPEVFEQVCVGECVWFDDGRIGARVIATHEDRLRLAITSARPQGEKLRADKGINLPDTALDLPGLTKKDLRDLAFVCEHADAVAMSFVRDASDIVDLEKRVIAAGRPDLGIVPKIETRRAFEQLPRLLLAAMQNPRSGVMIARGDLAVECGFERLAEVQEEILWVCEAAHVPVIWATQVLETLAKEGRPSRAEITDAAMSERAECVMLNKGPHIDQALVALDDILRRMEGHQRKKSAMLRPLRLALELGA